MYSSKLYLQTSVSGSPRRDRANIQLCGGVRGIAGIDPIPFWSTAPMSSCQVMAQMPDYGQSRRVSMNDATVGNYGVSPSFRPEDYTVLSNILCGRWTAGIAVDRK